MLFSIFSLPFFYSIKQMTSFRKNIPIQCKSSELGDLIIVSSNIPSLKQNEATVYQDRNVWFSLKDNLIFSRSCTHSTYSSPVQSTYSSPVHSTYSSHVHSTYSSPVHSTYSSPVHSTYSFPQFQYIQSTTIKQNQRSKIWQPSVCSNQFASVFGLFNKYDIVVCIYRSTG